MKPSMHFPDFDFLNSPLSRESGDSLQQQLYYRIKNAINEGKLKPGDKLPGTRKVCETLNIGRNTVIIVYELLAAEGFVISDNTGTRISAMSPESAPVLPAAVNKSAISMGSIDITQQVINSAFFPGIPALNIFPHNEWRRAEDRASRKAGSTILNYGLPDGEPALKQAVASFLATSRGVNCMPEQVILSSGLHKTLQMCLRPITQKGDLVWVENPGYEFAKSPFRNAGLNVLPIDVDRDGINPSLEMWQKYPPRIIYLTPSNQYPSGAVLSLERRVSLVENAIKHNAIIIEDDYGGEFHHAGPHIISMQGINSQAPVIYIGSFSQMMFPALRIGFAVLPPSLSPEIKASLLTLPHGGNRLTQLTLTEFIESGRFIRHLNKMGKAYQQKRDKLIKALKKCLHCSYEISGQHGSTQLTLNLPAEINDKLLVEQAQQHGINMLPLSLFCAPGTAIKANGVIIGYANTPSDLYEMYIEKINQIIESQRK
ncbi:HTH-type transcriptional regulatory protein gabR [Cedecea davisae]|uniref:Transcriptional regulator, GntR family n=1 Tax=Cedecea davisae DSM 4568 TaxID=566551 RepID=S3IZU2_9ENTR|nr:PLP-dependent aminotransferase family protein [Cedecea davisae]EPF18021.1 transcriptional regulator, GntR family [Cedecea davisae DSM 4568]SUX28301.1 HTH-type transcriptional regulatory protein gabR [Cedecea davisae]